MEITTVSLIWPRPRITIKTKSFTEIVLYFLHEYFGIRCTQQHIPLSDMNLTLMWCFISWITSSRIEIMWRLRRWGIGIYRNIAVTVSIYCHSLHPRYQTDPSAPPRSYSSSHRGKPLPSHSPGQLSHHHPGFRCSPSH